MNLDQIDAGGKNCFLHGKNRFLPLYHFRNNLSFSYINTCQKSQVKMNSDQIDADEKNCFLHPKDRNQYHTWEEARGTNGSISL